MDTQTDTARAAALIGARLDRLPATRSVWLLALLLSLGAWFEIYDVLFTAYIGPGLIRSGLFSATTADFFSLGGLAAFVAATFAGLFAGSLALGALADRYGRKTIFNTALLWYSAATLVMALQHSASAIVLWRFLAGIGLGMELVTIDTYLSELMPARLRGRAFAFNHVVQFTSVPVVALLAWWFVPRAPLGFDGWRWVVLFGALGAALVWIARRRLPESPAWLARQGRNEEAERIVSELEQRAAAESGQALPAVQEPAATTSAAIVRMAAAWQAPYRRRTLMLMVFNFFQTIGYYGFAAWAPTLLISQGVTVTKSLLYAFAIALANPLGPLLALSFADRIERKWLIVGAALLVCVAGGVFATQRTALPLIVCGVLVTLGNNCMSLAYHAYQAELFPTAIRARAVGMVYSLSRLGAMLSGFLIAFCLRHAGVPGVFGLIGLAMAMVIGSIGLFGPRSKGLALDRI